MGTDMGKDMKKKTNVTEWIRYCESCGGKVNGGKTEILKTDGEKVYVTTYYSPCACGYKELDKRVYGTNHDCLDCWEKNLGTCACK